MPLPSSRRADKEATPWTAVTKSWQAARLARQMAPLSSKSNAGHPAFSRTKSVCRLIRQTNTLFSSCSQTKRSGSKTKNKGGSPFSQKRQGKSRSGESRVGEEGWYLGG